MSFLDTHGPVPSTFRDWTGERAVVTLGSNSGSATLPFQSWRRFKEAFAPELIARAVAQHPRKVQSVIDPFGGSGTTALACQFLRIHPSTIEVNPYLADLIEAKLVSYEPGSIASNMSRLLNAADRVTVDPITYFEAAPSTFIEPGERGRWIFGRDIAAEAAALVTALKDISDLNVRRLFRVLLGSVLVELSNVVVSGKGRRYRRGWEKREIHAADLRSAFVHSVGRAVHDVARYAGQRSRDYTILRGDARQLVGELPISDLAIYSPPYPNSFDYTDVYNVELWMLGYLRAGHENQKLRRSTFSSHVQLSRDYSPPPAGSPLLDRTLQRLELVRDELWNPHIPAMIGAYFAEMVQLIGNVARRLGSSGRQWIVVGDSRYAGIDVPVASILSELIPAEGLSLELAEPFRSMRAAPQQGGRPELIETLLVVGQA